MYKYNWFVSFHFTDTVGGGFGNCVWDTHTEVLDYADVQDKLTKEIGKQVVILYYRRID